MEDSQLMREVAIQAAATGIFIAAVAQAARNMAVAAVHEDHAGDTTIARIGAIAALLMKKQTNELGPNAPAVRDSLRGMLQRLLRAYDGMDPIPEHEVDSIEW